MLNPNHYSHFLIEAIILYRRHRVSNPILRPGVNFLRGRSGGHVIKYGLDWIDKTWTGLIKHGVIKHGLIKHGLIKHGVSVLQSIDIRRRNLLLISLRA